MKKIFFSLVMLFTASAWANLHLAPPDFNLSGGRAVFVDFKRAEYKILYDFRSKRVLVSSRIEFESSQAGNPVFDIKPNPFNLKIDGQKITQSLVNVPGKVSKVRVLNRNIPKGSHVLEMQNYILDNVYFEKNPLQYVSSAFWIRDLTDRMFLEQYVPSNLEFDQYQMNLYVKFEGFQDLDQDIFTNGKLTQISENSWKIEFPDYFTVSCPFFHTTRANWMKRKDFNYQSIDGREIPITVYSPTQTRTNAFEKATKKYMAELEADYGAWGHPSFVAYGTVTGTGGMEHAGATASSIGALDHEMLHSYFAKGVMAANGNSGWIDEAIASWRDKGYPTYTTPGFSGSNLGAHSLYTRKTDDRAYDLGAKFMAYLDYRLGNQGGLKNFLKGYFKAYNHTMITTEHFKNNLQFFTGIDFHEEFWTYIWGKNSSEKSSQIRANPVHIELSDRQLKSML